MRGIGIALALLWGCAGIPSGDDRGDAGTGLVRLLRPRTGATTYARRPWLRWYRVDATVDARVELCRDRGCREAILSFDATGEESRVPSDLPSGIVFWRVRPRRGATLAAWTSTTGWFVVGRGASDAERHVRSAWRPRLQIDVDGDGRADAILPDGTIYRSEGARFEAVPYGRLQLANNQGAVTAGDVNGDGHLDIAVAAPSGRPQGVVYVYNGPLPRGLVAPSRQIPAPDGAQWVFSDTANWRDAQAADMNGDGYDDLLLWSREVDGSSRVHLYLGGRQGISQEPAQTLGAPYSRPTLVTASAAGDLDGDGYDDAVFGAPVFRTASAAGLSLQGAFAHRGSRAGLVTPPAWVLRNTADGINSSGAMGDFGGGPAVAMHIAAQGRPCVRVYEEVFGEAREAATVCGGAQESMGDSIDAGDVDGDGRADLVVSVRDPANTDETRSLFRVYRASRRGAEEWSAETIGRQPQTATGPQRMGLGDVDGDGVMDALAWAATPLGTRVLFVHRGGAEGLVEAGERLGR